MRRTPSLQELTGRLYTAGRCENRKIFYIARHQNIDIVFFGRQHHMSIFGVKICYSAFGERRVIRWRGPLTGQVLQRLFCRDIWLHVQQWQDIPESYRHRSV